MGNTKGIDINFNDLAKGIFNGDITPRKLPEDLYHKTAKNLLDPIHKAFHGSQGDQPFMSPNYKLLGELSNNIYMFSAAKTFQQVKAVSELMVNGDRVVPFPEFRKQAVDLLGLYNEQYLAAEHDTAEMMGRAAEKWNKIQAEKEIFPYLRYSDVDDAHECEICGGLHGMVARADDEVWDDFMPPNHFYCRCTVEQLEEDDDVPSGDLEERSAEAKELMDPLFLMNPGKDKVIYQDEGPDKHPYFIVPKEYKDFAADNFNLPIPVVDVATTTPSIPQLTIPKTEQATAIYPNLELRIDNAATAEFKSKIGKKEAQAYAALSGVPNDFTGKLLISKTKEGIQVNISGDNMTLIRTFKSKTTIHNDLFVIGQDSKYKGHGADILKAQVDKARSLGYKKITTNAAKGTNRHFNGYYTWLRLGYVPDLSAEADAASWGRYEANFVIKANKALKADFKSLPELMTTGEGRMYWREHGFALQLKFDLKQDSWSSKVLNQYVSEKKH